MQFHGQCEKKGNNLYITHAELFLFNNTIPKYKRRFTYLLRFEAQG